MEKLENCVYKISNREKGYVEFKTGCNNYLKLTNDCVKIENSFKYCPFCGNEIKMYSEIKIKWSLLLSMKKTKMQRKELEED